MQNSTNIEHREKYNVCCHQEAGIKFWKNRNLTEVVVGQVEATAFNVFKVFQVRVIKSSQFKKGS